MIIRVSDFPINPVQWFLCVSMYFGLLYWNWNRLWFYTQKLVVITWWALEFIWFYFLAVFSYVNVIKRFWKNLGKMKTNQCGKKSQNTGISRFWYNFMKRFFLKTIRESPNESDTALFTSISSGRIWSNQLNSQKWTSIKLRF